jgi:chemotaxis-related protein WspB
MLFVLLEIDSDRYAIAAAKVAEVLPLVHITRIAQAPHGVAGVFNYRGAPVPVVDLSLLVANRPAAPRYSTRLVLVQLADGDGRSRLLALIAERATATLQRDPAEFVPSGIDRSGAAYLGPVATDPRGVIQWIDPARILPAAVHDALLNEPDQS